ncbi:MAG: hypothetical protein R3B45_15495 [Bdellovibrionota bacterium]
MEKQADLQIRSQLTSKWPKFSKVEVDDILSHHDHLRNSLKKHYKMDDKEAKKEEEMFFKSYGSKKTSACG